MKHSLLGVFALILISAWQTAAGKCNTILSPMGNLGDYEIVEDPEAPGNLLLTANLGEDTTAGTPIAVFDMDGTTGAVDPSPTIVAQDYTGVILLNGPEFVYIPGEGGVESMLCVLYHGGTRSVHSSCRRNGVWGHDVFGDLASDPPALPGTEVGFYPGFQVMGLVTHHEVLRVSDSVVSGA